MADTTNRTGSPTRAETSAQRAASGERRNVERRNGPPSFSTVREEDLEPHEGLRYIARLFKILSVFLILLLIGEAVVGFVQLGSAAIPTLVVEATRLIVFAAFLWAAGDIAMMLIESNHDLRASRILLGRLNGKMQRLTDLEADEIERLAANPSLQADRSDNGTIVRRMGDGDEAG